MTELDLFKAILDRVKACGDVELDGVCRCQECPLYARNGGEDLCGKLTAYAIDNEEEV